ncbi:MAG: MG2 domain-containing protein [Puniceicoccales bacterium]
MFRRFLVSLATCLLASVVLAQDAASIFDQANADYTKHNYRTAAEAYAKLLQMESLPADVSRDELIYRQADATWRNLASTRQSDNDALRIPRRSLEKLAERLHEDAKGARPPELWAKAQESLGDSYWIPDQFRNWNQAWSHYQEALKWWAGSDELETARAHYIDIVFRASRPQSNRNYRYVYGYGFNNWMPYQVLRNTLELANTPNEKAYANYLLALDSGRQYGERSMDAGNYFQAAIDAGKGTDWRDDALYRYGTWAEQKGGSHFNEQGNYVQLPDYELAVKLFRQFLSDYQKGDSQYWDEVENRLKNITQATLNVFVNQNFLPENKITFNVNWRNLDQVAVSIYQIDPAQDIELGKNSSPLNLREDDSRINVSSRTPAWNTTMKADNVPYGRQNSAVQLDEGLPAGTYVIQAAAGGEIAQSILLVTQQTLTVLRDDDEILAWLTDAVTGEPVAEADVSVRLQRTWYRNNQHHYEWVEATTSTDQDGLTKLTAESFAKLRDRPLTDFRSMFAISKSEENYAVVERSYYGHGSDDATWKIYAYTDRPAYRPEDTIHWKATARTRRGADNWSSPSGEPAYYKIISPRGEEVASGVMQLNEYGSMWGQVEATKDWALGMYRIEFREKSDSGSWIGSAELFRLEEYKLPEFKVSVQTAAQDGEASTAYRLGDTVEIEILADYYFGGAVANADVEVVVRQSPYFHYWSPPRPYPWFYRDQNPYGNFRHYGGGQEIRREQLKTDAEGRATLTLETDRGSRQDLEYTIEARVVDESRREVSGEAQIRATRQPYFVYVTPERTLYRPGEKAEVTIKALNANDDPVAVEGNIRLTREEWMEIWRGPDGEEISGEEYRRRLRGGGLFSSALNPVNWTRIRQGYDVEEIQQTTLRTNAEGEATFAFTVAKAGYYRVSWVSQPKRSAPIKADAVVWVADDATLSIGYHGELQIVADEDSFKEGLPAPVMLTTAQPGRWVLFSVQGGELLDTRVVYLEGNVKLLTYDVTEQWVPNVWLQANANYNLRAHTDRKQIIVPPEKNFIDVDISMNAEEFKPREKGRVTITTKSVDGRPVPAEVALSVFDEAVLAIQPSLAPDPREFFYGDMRPDSVVTADSTQFRSFAIPEVAESASDANAPSRDRSSMVADNESGMLGMVSSVAESAPVDYFAAPAAAPVMQRGFRDEAKKEMDVALSAAGGGSEPNVVVRTDFRATAFWRPAIITNENGEAEVEVDFPDTLTTWNLEAHAVGLPAKFGEGEASVKTRLPLIARLQTPRFLVTMDQVTL